MPKYLVRQRRPMWVCFVQEVEAEDAEAAEEEFNNSFNPPHAIIEGSVQLCKSGPVTVWEKDIYPTVDIVMEQD